MEGINEQELGLSEEELAALSDEERAELGLDEVENEEEEEGPVETDALGRRIKKVKVETENKNLKRKIKVEVLVPLAPSVTAYAGEDFYASEEALKKAIDADWARRKANAARPILRDAESEMDFQTVAQQAADSYKPGRRGGFAPTIELDVLKQASSIDDVIKLLQERGVQLT